MAELVIVFAAVDKISPQPGLTGLADDLLHEQQGLSAVMQQNPSDDRLLTAPHWSDFQLDPLGVS